MIDGRKPFQPYRGDVYENRGGGTFRCLDDYNRFFCVSGFEDMPPTALMQNVKSGWTFKAIGIVQYPDGTIEWDYSKEGRFEEVSQ